MCVRSPAMFVVEYQHALRDRSPSTKPTGRTAEGAADRAGDHPNGDAKNDAKPTYLVDDSA